jgi:hypothetical protein
MELQWQEIQAQETGQRLLVPACGKARVVCCTRVPPGAGIMCHYFASPAPANTYIINFQMADTDHQAKKQKVEGVCVKQM